MSETAVLFPIETVDFEGKGWEEKGKDGNLPYHCFDRFIMSIASTLIVNPSKGTKDRGVIFP